MSSVETQTREHPFFVAEGVDQQGDVVSLHVVKQKSGTFFLTDTIGDFADFQIGANGRVDMLQLSHAVQNFYEITQIFESHRFVMLDQRPVVPPSISF